MSFISVATFFIAVIALGFGIAALVVAVNNTNNITTDVLSTTLNGFQSQTGTLSSSTTVLQGMEFLNANDALNMPLTGGTFGGDVDMNNHLLTNANSITTTSLTATSLTATSITQTSPSVCNVWVTNTETISITTTPSTIHFSGFTTDLIIDFGLNTSGPIYEGTDTKIFRIGLEFVIASLAAGNTLTFQLFVNGAATSVATDVNFASADILTPIKLGCVARVPNLGVISLRGSIDTTTTDVLFRDVQWFISQV
jgi:hypothetical protein